MTVSLAGIFRPWAAGRGERDAAPGTAARGSAQRERARAGLTHRIGSAPR